MALMPEELQARLRDWLETHIHGWSDVQVEPIHAPSGQGFSAEIFVVDVSYAELGQARSASLVVRRQPLDFEVVLGSSLKLQGQMLAALDQAAVAPVPQWIGMELNQAVLGQPFLVMGKVEGRSASQRPNYNVEGWLADMSPDRRAATWRNAVEAFACLSGLDWRRDGFDFLARPDWGQPGLDQYLGHLEAWYQGCRKDRSLLYVDRAMRYIRDHQPTDASVHVLWGDSTPSNVLFADDGEVNALIDWELAALGPAELDLAWWLYFDDLFSRRFGIPRLEGLPTREQTIAIWEEAVGRKALHLKYYGVVVALRMALVAVGAFDRQVGVGNIPPENKSLNANFMTATLAEKLGMELPELGPDFVAFMSKMTPVKEPVD